MADTPQTLQSLHQRISSLSPAQQQLFRKQLEAKGIPWEQAVAAADKSTHATTKTAAITRPERLPLSASQKQLWVLHQLYPETTAYHISLVLTMKGTLATEALQRSLQSIINRHESLRTVFLQEENQPYTKVLPSVELVIPVIDLRGATEPQGKATRHQEQLAQQPFDLENGPLIRAQLLRREDHVFELGLVLHHLIADGWSRGILLRELAINYRRYSQANGQGRQDKSAEPLPHLSLQYPDYVLKQQQWLQSNHCQGQREYWQQQLANLPELTLPFERTLLKEGTAATTFTSHTCMQTFSAEQTQAIKALAKESGATVFMVLLAIFKLLLHRYSRQQDIAVGIPVAGRNSAAVEPLIGFFVNTLVLRSHIAPHQPFPAWLKQVQATLADALQHQDIPFSEVVDAVGAPRIPGKNPLFQIMFQVQSDGYQLQNAEQLGLGMPGLTLTQQWIEPGETKFDMSWHVIERDGKLLVAVEYRTALFSSDRITRMLEHFHTLVNAVITQPEQPVSQFLLLSPQAREQILQDWGQGKAVEPATLCFPARFEEQVEKTPDAIALIDHATSPKQHITYHQLNQRANQLAHWLRAQGIASNSLVGICLPPGVDLMTALLATLKAGGAYVPLDPTLPAERLCYMVKDARPAVLIGLSDGLSDSFAEEISAKVIYLDRDNPQLISHPEQNPEQNSRNNLEHKITPQDLAYVIYTSGSTGNPKGTQLTHGGLINYLNWCLEAYPVDQGCGAPVQSAIGFDATITSLFSPLLAGKQVIFGLGDTEIDALQSALSGGFSFIKLTPAHLSALQPLLTTQTLDRNRLPKAFIIGGEALQEHHISTWRQHYPEVALFNEYGPTEAVVGCCVRQITQQERGNIPIGRPINGVQLYVLDETQHPVPAGLPGELYIGGAGVARGYLNQPDLTAERFVEIEGLGRVYKTGDLASYRPDGTLEYLGRIDSQIKLRGFRIEPGEIETLLCQHPQVEQAVVVLRAEKNKRELVAYITPTDATLTDATLTDATLTDATTDLTDKLTQHLRQALPSYMVPSHIVPLESLPLTINGKIDRKALPAPLVKTKAGHVQPRDRKERILLAIWQQILANDALGVHDNFFDLGGDSISGMQIVSKAHEKGLHLTPAQLFQHQTIAEQAAIATEKSSIDVSATPALGKVPLSPIQQNFFEQNLSNPHHYNQAVMLTVTSDSQADVIQSALTAIARHHDSLRLRFEKGVFEKEAERWQQQYADSDTVSVELADIDLTGQNARSLNAVITEVQTSLNLTKGPLFKGALLTLASGKHLLLVAHHLLIDGVSWRILLTDLLTAHQQITDRQPVTLPAKTTAFGNWTRHLNEQIRENTFEPERSYWLEACRETSPLPVEHPSGLNTVADTQEIVVALSTQETTALKGLNWPVNVLLLGAIAQTLKQWSQCNSFVVDMEGHGRHTWDESFDLSRTVGWFTALYPLRLSLPSGGFDELLTEVKNQLAQVPNGGVGYGALKFSAPEKSPQALVSPAKISFNYLGQLAVETTGFITGLADEPVPETKSPKNDRSYPFEIVALIQAGQLHIRWRYSQQQYERSTLEQLGGRLHSNLISLIAHCQQPEKTAVVAADFAAARVDKSQLNKLMGKLNAREGR
ncbi:MAG: amino acid adenylation domain-containing protein [Cyanobacteria bacterium P01_A01_bin.116]